MNTPKESADITPAENPGAEPHGGLGNESSNLQSFLMRLARDPDFSRDFLMRVLQDPETYLTRLATLERELEEANKLDEKTQSTILYLRRQLEATLPPPGDGMDCEFEVPIRFRRGAQTKNQKASVDSAVEMIAAVARELGVPDLSGTSMLDIGCGVKFTQAFYGRKVPVKRYHGVDVDLDMIEFLSSNVKDDRFSYKHIDIFNARYRKTGKALSAETDIGVLGETFDFICLFSVFTHLAPPDYRAMLDLARKYISPTGTFLFTTFIDSTMQDDFMDSDPSQPLLMALYKEGAVREFTAAARWSIQRIFLNRMQYWVVCEPA